MTALYVNVNVSKIRNLISQRANRPDLPASATPAQRKREADEAEAEFTVIFEAGLNLLEETLVNLNTISLNSERIATALEGLVIAALEVGLVIAQRT